MHQYNPILQEQGQFFAVRRASVGLYLIYKQCLTEGDCVLFPANICYAAIYPAVFAGLVPVFCDVDPLSGNVTKDTFHAALQKYSVKAAVVPHMYGNPVRDLKEIVELCRKRSVLLIEDCASAMGTRSEEYPLGDMGDYCVYSTGYSKTIDLGFGGFVWSRHHDLTLLEECEKSLPVPSEQTEANEAFFSRLYRLIRNEGHGTPIEKMIFRHLPECVRLDFVHRATPEEKTYLYAGLEKLPGIMEQRRQGWRCYENHLCAEQFTRYPYAELAVPWRYNILLNDATDTRVFICECLEAHLPVSDWYPNVTPLFGGKQPFPGSDWHEKHIVNFPLPADKQEILRICDVVNAILRHK